MTKSELLAIIYKILDTNDNLDFLLALNSENLKTLIACIRERIEH